MKRNLKEKILDLRNQGFSYNKIAQELNCSKSAISYHVGEGQKQKYKKRKQNNNNKNPLIKKRDHFVNSRLRSKHVRFNTLSNEYIPSFNCKDIIEKFGTDTKCYLTGEPINLLIDDYELDHIIPRSKGGSNSIDNLGILKSDVNRAKHSLTNEQFIELCRRVLIYNGYDVINKNSGVVE